MTPVRGIILLIAAMMFMAFGKSPAFAATLGVNDGSVIDGKYKLPASLDSTVTTRLKTELWAHVWRPSTGGPHPLVVFLHGNHGTCGRFDAARGIRVDDLLDYTITGTCPPGYVVTPNHRGYDYLAGSLASYGYVVVSINANRGVNAAPGVSGDDGLNLRRGRLVLRHLQQLARWNTSGGAPGSLGFNLTGLIDFSQVGLMGHSRGGEGMRAAVAQYLDAGSLWPTRIGPVTFRSIFEIGPVDGQTSRTLNAVNLVWNVLLPACDGDVSNLEGVKPFDRMLKITNEKRSLKKSTFQVFGANHNFYNTEWQESDSSGCLGQTPLFPQFGGSAKQRKTASQTLIPFFRSNLGPMPEANLARRFDPSVPLPTALASVTSYARGYTPTPRASQNLIVDNFDKPTGTSSRGVANQSSSLTQYRHGQAGSSHDPAQRAAAVNWSKAGGFLQVNAAAPGKGLDVSALKALEFRVMLRCFGTLCSSTPSPTGDVDFSIALANGDSTLSAPITLKSRAVVRRPGGSFSTNELFQTVRIPLASFIGANSTSFLGIRFTFNRTANSSIYLGNVRLTKTAAVDTILATAAIEPQTDSEAVALAEVQAAEEAELNEIVAIRHVGGDASLSSSMSGEAVEIEVASTRAFPIGGALPTLVIGDRAFTLSRFSSGATDRFIFTVDAAEFNALKDGDEVSVHVGGARSWNFGPLNKAIAQ